MAYGSYGGYGSSFGIYTGGVGAPYFDVGVGAVDVPDAGPGTVLPDLGPYMEQLQVLGFDANVYDQLFGQASQGTLEPINETQRPIYLEGIDWFNEQGALIQEGQTLPPGLSVGDQTRYGELKMLDYQTRLYGAQQGLKGEPLAWVPEDLTPPYEEPPPGTEGPPDPPKEEPPVDDGDVPTDPPYIPPVEPRVPRAGLAPTAQQTFEARTAGAGGQLLADLNAKANLRKRKGQTLVTVPSGSALGRFGG